MENNKFGLTLGIGAAPGVAHVGVIQALEEANIFPDYITGTSIGALVGACYASHGDINKLKESFLNLDVKKFVEKIDLSIFLLSKGFIKGKGVREFLKPIIGDIEFKDLKIPLSVVATDVYTGEEVVLNSGLS